ncbi:MAG: glutaminyl-peptide cyclotransferase [Bacteroidales bacterium]|nr:glutaminyl-peptide cyclotransferase [Bacteroidales bacterium]
MKRRTKLYTSSTFRLLILAAGMVAACSCSNKGGENQQEPPREKEKKKDTYKEVTSLRAMEQKDLYTAGTKIVFHLEWPDTVSIDSIKTYTNNQQREAIYQAAAEIPIGTEGLAMGNNTFKVEAFLNNGHKETHYQALRLKSNIKPRAYRCQVEQTYPHDPTAFTQGLYYEKGYLYEGTGKRGGSSLRKIELKSGDLISSLALPAEYFGEGITGFKDKIIQLTWTSRTGFIYDKESFRLINKVRYPTEGWGLTTDGSRLIMSDGSATIYFLTPNFNETGRIKVYDNNGPVRNLNELEYINGKVYANVYQQDYIISFNPENGKVLEKIDCSSLVPDQYKNSREYVLNGIAWDPEDQCLFLTGKRWDKVYQIALPE